MRRHRVRSVVLSALVLATACGGPRTSPPDYPDVVVGTEPGGSPIRERGRDDRARMPFAASPDKLYDAVATSYTALGIMPSIADREGHRYGNIGFLFPNDFDGSNAGAFFDCGADNTGPLAGHGRLIATVLTTLISLDSTTTVAATQVTGTMRRMDGTSTRAANCKSTGKLETMLKKEIALRLR